MEKTRLHPALKGAAFGALALAWTLTAPAAAGAARGGLSVAAGKTDITPDLAHETIWLAGFGASGRRARGIRDPLFARAMLVSDGKKTAALVAVDAIGLYREDVLEMRRRLGWNSEDRYLLVAATHDHAAPDTMGLWGRLPGFSGVDADYRENVLRAVVSMVNELSTRLEPAEFWAARADPDPKGLCRDSRDPTVLDPELEALQARAKDGRVLGTLVRWSCHPEVMWSDNMGVSADFPGALCARIEQETASNCVYFSGSLGGLMTPDTPHSQGPERDYAEMARIGDAVAGIALNALKRPDPVRGEVAFFSRTVRLPVENSRYLLLLHSLAFGHSLFDAQGKALGGLRRTWLSLRHLAAFPLPERLRPWVETEVSRIRIGPVEFLGVPGEIFPELVVGGYDGRFRFGQPLVDPSNPNPPRLESAPKGPYLRDKVKAKHGIVIGLANDEIGYILPEYDFQVAPTRLMLPKPKGTHYEETNSIGPSAAPILLKAFDELLSR